MPERPQRSGPSSGGWIAILVVGGVLVAAVAVLTTLLLTGEDDDDPAEIAVAGQVEPPVETVLPTSTTAPVTTSAVPTTEAATVPIDRSEAIEASVRRIDNMLAQSSAGRTEIISIVDRVQRCDVSLGEAQRSIASIIENRNSVLGQISSLRVEAAPALDASIDALQRSLQHSVEANRHYQAWFAWLDTEWGYLYYDACWYDGVAPTNTDYADATAASGRATTAKREFVGHYNPLAGQFGLRTWTDTEF